MQITLDSSEIKQAIVSYVKDQGIDLTNTTVEVGMTAGRGANGTTATVDIIPKIKSTSTGVKNNFHNVANLTPRTITEEVELEEEELIEVTDPVPEDTDEEEETEEEEVASATNSIFK
jgi:hypothetical protein